MKKRIPLVPFSLPLARGISKPFYGVSGKLSKIFPDLGVKLDQAEIKIQPREYLAIACFCFWFWPTIIFYPLLILSWFAAFPGNFIFIIATISLIVGVLSFVYIILYPHLIVNRKTRDLEKNLLFALRHLLIQVKSGVPLFDGLVSVSKGDYGLIAEEFKSSVKKISTGLSETASLEELIFKNPSLHFRRVIWQITNAMRTGADLGNTLEAIVQNLSDEQKVAIRRYGSQLNPLSMMYMMTAVILPSLGITFLVLLSTFTGVPVSEILFWLILVVLAVFQFMFIGIVKNRRPAIEL